MIIKFNGKDMSEMSIEVVKRDGRSEDFDREKIAKTVMDAAYTVGGDDYELAEEVAEDVEDRLEESGIKVIKSTDLQKVVEEVLIKRGHDQTAREYIVEGAARDRQREMNTQIMKEIEEITFVAPDQSETKRENANIDSSTAMGVMLKYGSESAKKFNLMTVISSKVANAHIDGDIHIHDLDFYTLTETCICKDAVLKIKENGKEYEITFGDFMLHVVKELYKLNGISLDRIYDVSDYNIEVMSKGKYTKVVNVVAHSSIGKKTMRIWLENGDNVSLTSDHRVVTKDASGEKIDKKAEELVVGELISTGSGDFVAIKQLEDINYMACVYDMETENHYFTANNINVHNCCQIPLDKLFNGGFNTGHGFLRQPSGIRAAGALAAIAVQSNQNDQHGGQSIPLFDFYLAPYVALTYVKQVAKVAKFKLDLSNERYKELKAILVDYHKKNTLLMDEAHVEEIKGIVRDFFNKYNIKCSDKRINRIMEDAYDDTYDETFQSMEAFVHNLNTMHCLPASEKIWVLDVKTGDFKSITMEELDNEFEEHRFKVISLNKKTGKSEFKFITHCKKLDNNRNLVKITDNQGRTVTVTDNHRIMTIDGINITENTTDKCEYTLSPRGITFPAVKYDLCVSDYGKPRRDNPFQNDHVLVNEKFAEFIGYYMADGCILGETSTCCISACGKVTFDYMEKLIEDVFGVQLKTSYTYYKNSKSGEVEEKDIRIQLGMPLAKMIKHKFGRVGHEKKIPVELMFASESVRKAFLKAYFKLDGRKDRNYAEISTVNKELQAQVAFMLSSLGVSSHYTTRSCTNGFDCTKERDDLHFITLSGHDAYEAGIKDEDNTAFEIPKYYLGNVYEAYEDICDDITSRRGSKNLRYSELSELIDEHDASDVKHLMNVYANNIVMKDSINSGDEYVYDISVEDNENFLTYECIFVHNSRAGRRANMVDVPVTWETLCSAV